MLVLFDVIGEDIDLEPGDVLDHVGKSAEVEQRSHGRQADQEVDVAVIGVVTSNTRENPMSSRAARMSSAARSIRVVASSTIIDCRRIVSASGGS